MAKMYRLFQHPGFKNALLVFTLVIVVVTVLSVLISLATSWSSDRIFDTLFAGVASGLLLVSLGKMVSSRPKTGPVMLDAGPMVPDAEPFLKVGLPIILVLAYAVLATDFDFQHPISSLRSEMGSLLLLIFFATRAFGRLQVCEQGIWLYTALLPWHKIKAYTWKNGTLRFEINSWWFWTQKSCAVPEAHVEAFETYLLEHSIPESTPESVATA